MQNKVKLTVYEGLTDTALTYKGRGILLSRHLYMGKENTISPG